MAKNWLDSFSFVIFGPPNQDIWIRRVKKSIIYNDFQPYRLTEKLFDHELNEWLGSRPDKRPGRQLDLKIMKTH